MRQGAVQQMQALTLFTLRGHGVVDARAAAWW